MKPTNLVSSIDINDNAVPVNVNLTAGTLDIDLHDIKNGYKINRTYHCDNTVNLYEVVIDDDSVDGDKGRIIGYIYRFCTKPDGDIHFVSQNKCSAVGITDYDLYHNKAQTPTHSWVGPVSHAYAGLQSAANAVLNRYHEYLYR